MACPRTGGGSRCSAKWQVSRYVCVGRPIDRAGLNSRLGRSSGSMWAKVRLNSARLDLLPNACVFSGASMHGGCTRICSSSQPKRLLPSALPSMAMRKRKASNNGPSDCFAI